MKQQCELNTDLMNKGLRPQLGELYLGDNWQLNTDLMNKGLRLYEKRTINTLIN